LVLHNVERIVHFQAASRRKKKEKQRKKHVSQDSVHSAILSEFGGGRKQLIFSLEQRAFPRKVGNKKNKMQRNHSRLSLPVAILYNQQKHTSTTPKS
jgi:hypothetical protein